MGGSAGCPVRFLHHGVVRQAFKRVSLSSLQKDSMAKVTISRIFEITKLLTTKSGQELKDGLTYLSDFAEITLRNLRNGLTYADNFACEVKSITIKNNTETIITPITTKRVNQVVVRKSTSSKYYCLDSFGWKYNSDGEIVVKLKFTDFDALDSALAFPVEILLYY